MAIKVTPYELRYKIEDEDEDNEYIEYFKSFEGLMDAASKMYAFDDCCPVEIISIKAEGRSIKYYGWRPMMRFTFKDYNTGEVVWDNYYEWWDH